MATSHTLRIRVGRAWAGLGGVTGGGGSGQPDMGQMQMLVQLEMLKALRDLRRESTFRDDAPAADELDGLRVARQLGRMRALRQQMEDNPKRTYVEYRNSWIRELYCTGGGHTRHPVDADGEDWIYSRGGPVGQL